MPPYEPYLLAKLLVDEHLRRSAEERQAPPRRRSSRVASLVAAARALVLATRTVAAPTDAVPTLRDYPYPTRG